MSENERKKTKQEKPKNILKVDLIKNLWELYVY